YGKFIKKINFTGRGPGEYLTLENIITDKNSNIIVEDSKGLKFIKYDSDFNFISSFPKKVFSTVSDWLIEDNKLTCFYSGISIYDDLDKSIYTYDLNSGEIINKSGIVPEAHEKFDVLQAGGSLLNSQEALYYQYPLDYQLYASKNSKNYILFDEIPSNFKTIDKKFNVNELKPKYSILLKSFIIKNLIFIKFINPNDDAGILTFNIHDMNGNLVKSNLKTKNLFGKLIIVDNKIIHINDYKRKISSKLQRLNPFINIYTFKY